MKTLIEKYNSQTGQVFKVLDNNGVIINPSEMMTISDKDVLEAYKAMWLSRIQDKKQSAYQRSGKMLSFLSSTGQEATEYAYTKFLKKGLDWFAPAYRNNMAMLNMGVPMYQLMMYWGGNELGSKRPAGINVLPINIPIATQYSHATGIAFAEKYKGGKGIVVTTIGDGGTSEGEFYESMNFGALNKVPCIYVIENNQFAISTPREKATMTKTLAQKSVAVEIPNMMIDGNDLFACLSAMDEVVKYVRGGNGPILIEFITYRLGPHSTSDDPRVYRNEDLHAKWAATEPLIRLRKYLEAKKLWDDKKQEKLEEEHEAFVQAEFEKSQKMLDVTIDEIFDHTFEKLTPDLVEQKAAAKAGK